MTVTSTGESGCSLRVAIQAVAANDSGTACGAVVSGGPTPINLPANTITPFDGQIVVPAGVNVQINGDNVNNPLTTVIDGTGATAGRIFEIKSGASVKLSGLTVTGGQALNGAAPTSRFASYSGQDGGGILNGGNLTLDHVVLNGNHAGDGGDGWNGLLEESGGGAGWGGNGGGIYNSDGASLTITNSEISGNFAGQGGTGGSGGNGAGGLGHNPDGRSGGNGGRGGSGGGIYNSNFGSLSIDRSTISGNQSGRGGNGGGGGLGAGPSPNGSGGEFSGGKGGDGGDGGNNGRLIRKDGNTPFDEALGGGGIYNVGSMTMTNSTVSGNNTGAGGTGGPSGYGGKRNSDSNIFQSSGRAGWGGGGGRGGGLLNGSQQQGSMTLTNVTVTQNLTGDGGDGGGGAGGTDNTLGGGQGGIGGDGGGLWAQGAHNNIALLTHVTIVKNFVGARGLGGNSANGAGNPGTRGVGAGIAVGGRYNQSGAGVYLKNSLISANGFSGDPTYDKNCSQQQPVANYQEFGDQGNNLSYPLDGSPCPGQTNTDPDLGPLGNNGGPTETILPQPGSAAIGGVPLASCSVPNDQRGLPRPGDDGTSCDIGAIEVGTAPALTETTTGLNSSLNPSKSGQSVTFTATVSPPPSSGTVAFSDGGTTISGCEASPLKPGGQFTCSTSSLTTGTHSIFAIYSGNTLFASSLSPTLNQVVNADQPSPKAKISKVAVSGPSSVKKGAKAAFTVKITNGGNASATGVKLKVTGGGASASRTVGGITAGRTKTVKLSIRLNRTGRKQLTFHVTSANAGSKTERAWLFVRPLTGIRH